MDTINRAVYKLALTQTEILVAEAGQLLSERRDPHLVVEKLNEAGLKAAVALIASGNGDKVFRRVCPDFKK